MDLDSSQAVTWLMLIQPTIETRVTNEFYQESHKWPLLKSCEVELYTWNERFVFLTIKDKLSGSNFVHEVKIFNNINDTPKEEPVPENIIEWNKYLVNTLGLRKQDAVFIFPIDMFIKYKGSREISEKWNTFSNDHRKIWDKQINYILTKHFYFIKGLSLNEEFYLPPGYGFLVDECSAFFSDYPNYEKNVFIMTRFSKDNHLLNTLDAELRKVLRSHGLNPVRADDKMYMSDRNLWNNVCVYMLCCKLGIAILEDRVKDEFNPNVALEYGFRRALNRPTLLLADKGFRNLRADIVGTLREEFDITDIENTIQEPVERWLKEVKVI